MSYGYASGFKLRPVNDYSGDAQRDLPKSYTEAATLYQWADKRRGKARGKIAHNTFLERRNIDGAYLVKLHRTVIVEFLPDGTIRLDTGGYQTATTRDRMNRCGIRIGMAGGIVEVFGHVYCDGMVFQGTSAERHRSLGPFYPEGVKPRTPDEARKVRRANLRTFKREEAAYQARRDARKPGEAPPNPAEVYPAIPFYWDTRSGGYAHRGNCPEAFA